MCGTSPSYSLIFGAIDGAELRKLTAFTTIGIKGYCRDISLRGTDYVRASFFYRRIGVDLWPLQSLRSVKISARTDFYECLVQENDTSSA